MNIVSQSSLNRNTDRLASACIAHALITLFTGSDWLVVSSCCSSFMMFNLNSPGPQWSAGRQREGEVSHLPVVTALSLLGFYADGCASVCPSVCLSVGHILVNISGHLERIYWLKLSL